MPEEAEADAPAYLDFPYEHHVGLRVDNVRERADRELRRRSRVVQVLPGRKPLIRMAGAVFSEMDEDRAGRRWLGDDSIGRAVEGAEVNEPARLRGHGGRARGQDHRARGGRQPDSRREGGVACARMTAFWAILGSSDSLRPPSRTEPYTNFRDTTANLGRTIGRAIVDQNPLHIAVALPFEGTKRCG